MSSGRSLGSGNGRRPSGKVMVPDFAVEHPDGRRAILETVGFWTPEYLVVKADEYLASRDR